MTDEQLTAEFEEQRPHLRAVAYRILGSVSEADDAVQEAWLRASTADTSDVDDMRAWLTTVVARVSLNMLRSRRSKRTRQLASRGRRWVEGETAVPDPDLGRQREVVGAFMAASREGNFQGLVAVLHADVVLRANMALGVSRHVRGGEGVARQALMYHTLDRFSRPALVNGAAGIVVSQWRADLRGHGLHRRGRKIVAIDILADPARLEQLALA